MKRWICICMVLSVLLSLFGGTAGGASAKWAETYEEKELQEESTTRGITASSVSVPAYSGGSSSGWMSYDCGETVTFHDTGVTSKMRIVTGTSASQFNSYCSKLTSSGYTRVYNKTVPAQSGSNLYGKFLYKDGSHSIYTYFTAAYSQTRIIVDTQNHTVEGFRYDGTGKLPVEVYMYSISTEESGWGLTDSRRTQYLDNAGAMYIIRMPDNSLYIQDGGSHNQMSERAMKDMYDFCRKITGIPEGQRMIISAWSISHGDTDHYRGFTRFIQAYHKDFDLKNVIYNFEIDNGTSYHFRRVTRHFPNVRYYKPHTGERFSIAGVNFDVLYTTEDRYSPSASNTLTPHDSSCIAADYLNYNNTSTVFKMSFDGKTMILSGDIFKADAILMKMYPASYLKADVLQIPHHGFDNHTTLAKTVAPQIIFLNQIQSAVLNRERLYNNDAGWRAYAKEIYYGGTEIVGYRADKGIFYRQAFGKPIETLGWSAVIYHIEDRNYQDNVASVKDPEPYYRYTRVRELTTAERAYIIVDDKLNKVLAYDNGTGGVASVVPSLYDGEHFYFSSSRRYLVNWLISARSTVANADAAVTGSTTYHGGVPIRKGSGDYWGSGSKNSGIYLGMASSYSAVGLHGAWSPFSSQLYAESKATWVDAMADGTFLIYRHGNGTYYPLYRDGDATSEKGWGCTKLTKAQVNSRLDNLRLRLYVYEQTPSDMYVSWSGHQDFYMEKGVPRKDLLGHISSDIRVRYSFTKFGGTGELPYDANYEANGAKTRGTYWLEFTKTYDPNTVGDYPVQIKYTNAAGATLTVGSLTVHVYERSIAQTPELQQLYFDFSDTDADRERYERNSQYSEVNFDGADRWKVTEDDADLGTSTYFAPIVDQAEGTLTAVIRNKSSSNRAVYIQPFAPTLYPLNYNPAYAQTVQIRLKMENLKACPGQEPFFRLWYYKGSDNLRKYDRNVLLGKNFVSDGEYVTFRFDLYSASEITALPAGGSKPDTTFAKAGKISGLRLGFHGLVLNDSSKEGKITLDYFYIGPKAYAPRDQVTVTFTAEDGSILQQEQVDIGQAAVFHGTVGNKESVPEGHYIFSHWVNETGERVDLSSVTEDLVLSPSYRMEPHSYGDPEPLDEEQHRQLCPCGYSLDSVHHWDSGELISHPCTQDGVTRYTCTDCGETQDSIIPMTGHRIVTIPGKEPTCTQGGFTAEESCSVCGELLQSAEPLPALGHSPTVEAGTPATCVSSGLTDLIYCDVCDQVLTQQKIIPRLGHDYRYSDRQDGTHRQSCTRCDQSITQEHSFTEGQCICGAEQWTEDPLIKINHTLNLASDISVNFAVAKELLAEYELSTVYLLCTRDVYSGNGKVGTVTEKLLPVEQGNYYYFTLSGLTAVQMNDGLQAVLYGYKAGRAFQSPTDEYSIAQYAYSRLEHKGSSAELKTLCADLLRYGTAAQVYKSYRTDAPADGAMTEEQRQWLSDADAVAFGSTNELLNDMEGATVSWIGRALNLESKVAVRMIFSTAAYTGELSDLSLRVSYRDITGTVQTVVITEAEVYNEEKQYYAFTFDSFRAAELRTVLSARIYCGDSPVSCTLQYSADTYGVGKTGNLGALCRMLFAYSDSARSYFLS